MIDAPDHAVGERGDRSAWVWFIAALLGIALSVVAGMMSYGYTTAQAEQRFADVVDYVATQSLSYDAFNSAYATKNLIRVMEIAGEAARDMERDGSVDNAALEQYADQFNVSALIVTDASGNLVSESSTDGAIDCWSSSAPSTTPTRQASVFLRTSSATCQSSTSRSARSAGVPHGTPRDCRRWRSNTWAIRLASTRSDSKRLDRIGRLSPGWSR